MGRASAVGAYLAAVSCITQGLELHYGLEFWSRKLKVVPTAVLFASMPPPSIIDVP